MKYHGLVLALFSLSGTIAQPHKEHHHMHQRHHEKRAVEWTTTWEIVTETVNITTTIWVDGDATSVEQSTTIALVPTTSTSTPTPTPTPTSTSTSTPTPTTHSPAEFHESSAIPPLAPTTLISVASYTPPAPSTSSSVYVPPAVPTSTNVASADPVTTPVYVAPTTTQAPYVAPDLATPTTAAAATTSPASSSSSSGGTCTSGSPCEGDVTFYQAGLGACGITSDGDTDLVIALPYELMGTQSNDNPYCGKTVTITKDGTSVQATVVDKCMGCKGYSIDLSNKAFSSLGIAFAVGRTQAEWYFN